MIRVARVFSVLVVTLIFAKLSSPVLAQQYGQYGPAPSLSIVVDKLVNKPGQSEFVDNLSPSDPRFTLSQDVFFRLKVKNPTDQTLTSVTVKDFLPDFIEFVEGPGSFDISNKTLTLNAGDFGPQEEKVYDLKVRVVAQDKLPSDKSIVCVVNRAQASNSQVSDEDTAQLCVEKQVTGAVQVPAAGPEMGLALIGLNMLGLSAGLYLRKRS